MRKHLPIAIIITASLITHFLFFGQPRETVFDEVHFGKFISGYFTHEYFFDIHPPLGKLMISGMGYISDFKPGFSFAEIGQQFPDRHYLWLRLLPTLAGTLLPIVIFYLILQLGMSRLAAFTGGMLVVLENALLVQSRFILLDSFLLLFGFLALLFYFRYKNLNQYSKFHILNYIFLFLAGFFAALAVSVKWTGATFLAIIIILEIIRCRFFPRSYLKATLIKNMLFFVVLPLTVYFLIFALHFSLLSKSGPGDAFMTPKFRKNLIGSTDSKNPEIKALNLFQKFNELNLQMYKSNATLTASHPYSSKWYSWPFMIRPIYYWNEADATTNNQQPATNKVESRIYFLGNPVIWWASTVAMFFLIINLIPSIFRLVMSWVLKKSHDIANREIKTLPVLLAGAYLLNLLPFIGIKRAMFLYHYTIGLVFATIALVYLIDQLPRKKKTAFAVLLIASATAFVFFAPLTYGLPLTEKSYNLRVWLQSWL